MDKVRKIRLSKTYPKGTKIKVLSINDPYISIPVGMTGTIVHTDNDGRIFVSFDKNRIFSLNLDKDKIMIERRTESKDRGNDQKLKERR